jgi:predicted ABC-type transport system involved in lysophospholipase L1 biosynthesis ATPase subunit
MVRAAEDWLKARGVVKREDFTKPWAMYGEQQRVLMVRWLDGRPMTP